MNSAAVRVELPFHLRTLAQVNGEVSLDVPPPITLRTVLDALESRYPVLRGTVRDHNTQQRRAFLRFFACQEDLSHQSPDDPLPDAVAAGREPLLIIGAIAGGTGPSGASRKPKPPQSSKAPIGRRVR
ncbi:MAG: MoaD/ThiS family protein [Acidobacteriaceae bacterium]